VFKSGISTGGGLTTCLQWHDHGNIRFGDTPGLSDTVNRRQAAAEITKALQQDGRYRLVFVCTVEAGRIRPDDVTTIDAVLEAIKDDTFPYGIVINKASARFIANYTLDKDVNEIIRASLNYGHRPTERIFLLPLDKELEDVDNAVTKSHPDFLQFISEMTPHMLPAHRVKAVDVDDFEAKKQKFELEIAQMKSDRDRRQKSLQLMQLQTRRRRRVMCSMGVAIFLAIALLRYKGII